jgi:flavin reductase (DIM6/NTAB) family NADH-FMN oxidoreductase RutF
MQNPDAANEHPVIDPLVFRQTMSAFATGVAVITTKSGDELHGMTVNSLTSVSLDPPLILVCLVREARTTQAVLAAGAFVVNFLSERQEAIAARFARRGTDHFGALPAALNSRGLPHIPKALGRLDCAVEMTHDGGDHLIVIGRVLECEIREGRPLLFFRARYHEISGPGHAADWYW